MNRNIHLPPKKDTENQGLVAAPMEANDVFVERFLTERPGCSDNEEVSSSCCKSVNIYDEKTDGIIRSWSIQNC